MNTNAPTAARDLSFVEVWGIVTPIFDVPNARLSVREEFSPYLPQVLQVVPAPLQAQAEV